MNHPTSDERYAAAVAPDRLLTPLGGLVLALVISAAFWVPFAQLLRVIL